MSTAPFSRSTGVMLEIIAKTFVTALAIYAALGLAFALPFVFLGVQRVDEEAKGAGVFFRFLILPGVAAFWPMFLTRWLQGIEPPIEANPHR